MYRCPVLSVLLLAVVSYVKDFCVRWKLVRWKHFREILGLSCDGRLPSRHRLEKTAQCMYSLVHYAANGQICVFSGGLLWPR